MLWITYSVTLNQCNTECISSHSGLTKCKCCKCHQGMLWLLACAQIEFQKFAQWHLYNMCPSRSRVNSWFVLKSHTSVGLPSVDPPKCTYRDRQISIRGVCVVTQLCGKGQPGGHNSIIAVWELMLQLCVALNADMGVIQREVVCSQGISLPMPLDG